MSDDDPSCPLTPWLPTSAPVSPNDSASLRKELQMKFRLNTWLAALAACLLGIPLADKAFAGTSGIVGSSIDLTGAIIEAAAKGS